MSRSILITGCSSGIGRHCAIRLAEAGWRVFATARNEADLADLAGRGLEALYLDYAEPDSIAAAAATVIEKTGGRLDALFNNGAYGQPGAVEDLTLDALRAQFEANFFGWHDLTRRVLPAMRAQGSGRIVLNSSVLGLVALKWRGAYNASKFAVEGLFDTLRLELRGSGIHVSLIEPGPIRTGFSERALAAFKAHIDTESSIHREAYARHLARLEGPPSRFTLEPEAVFRKLDHALNSPRPKPHYYVTTPTHLLAALRRLLPNRLLDPINDRFSG